MAQLPVLGQYTLIAVQKQDPTLSSIRETALSSGEIKNIAEGLYLKDVCLLESETPQNDLQLMSGVHMSRQFCFTVIVKWYYV